MKGKLGFIGLSLVFVLVGIMFVQAASQSLFSVSVNVSSTSNYSKTTVSTPSYVNFFSMITLSGFTGSSAKTYVKVSVYESGAYRGRIGQVANLGSEVGNVTIQKGYVGTAGRWKCELLGTHPETGETYSPWSGYWMVSSES